MAQSNPNPNPTPKQARNQPSSSSSTGRHLRDHAAVKQWYADRVAEAVARAG